jgi:hypothetical protein
MRQEDSVRQEASKPPTAVLVTFAAALLAGIAGAVASGMMAWIAVGAIALGGAYFASRTANPRKAMVDVARPRRLLLMLDRGGSADAKVPMEFTGEWGTLYERVNRLAFEARSQTAPTPGSELDQYRKHAELAASLLRDGKDPLAEAPELRAGPLQSLLEGARSSAALPVVSHLSLGEEGLIGEDGDTLPPDWPQRSGEGVTHVSGGEGVAHVPGGQSPAFESGLRDLVREIEALRTTLSGGRNGESPTASEEAVRTPAQLVDAVVLTAADGIEDLAAGLMRANELASVAERVTNRATLLALNAALEATRSGSEAFAAIAEETRRLAEFAREATDTISRLSSEIEYKVGETITAIHATSEDAKTSLAEMSGSAAPVPSTARSARVQVVRLLDRSRELLRILGAPAPQPQAGTHPANERNSAQELVENAPAPADNLPMEGILLIEGLKPGARLES